ncbi:MAG: hypothetical protein AAFR39_06070 [Pseudomonadota bacterium]
MNSNASAVTRAFSFNQFEMLSQFGEDSTADVFEQGSSLASHKVYNFEVENHHTYIADGIRVHNTSILSFLTPNELVNADYSTLSDTNGDGQFDYIQVDGVINGLAAGSTIYKLEDGGTVTGYTTFTNAEGKLVQVQFIRDSSGRIVQQTTIELTGAEFGEGVGAIVTPFITASLLGDDLSIFEKLAADSIIGTFVENAFEFAGGLIHDQIVSNGLQDKSFEAIADNTFGDIWDDFVSNTVDNTQTLLTQWIIAEVFEGLNTDEFGGKFAYLLAYEGVDAVLDLTINTIAVDVLDLSDEQIAAWGLTAPEFNQIFSPGNILNLSFKAAIGTILPALESLEAQIGSSVITLALDVFAGIGGVWGSVLGYIGGLILDLLFDEDPQALAGVELNPFTNELALSGVSSEDDGNRFLARSMAESYVEFINGVVESAEAKSHNLGALSDAMNLAFGHYEEHFRNGDGLDYATAQQAVQARILETLEGLVLTDGDVKIATAVGFIAASVNAQSAQELLSELSMRIQVAQDYQSYLENKGYYDALIAADPESVFAASWTTTFLLAVEYGYAQNYSVTGDDQSGVHILSSGDDFADGRGGDDELNGYAGDDTLRGGDGDDVLSGAEGHDDLHGQMGSDTIFGGGGNNYLRGGWGLDEFYLGTGDNTVDGGGDQDLATFFGAFEEYSIVDHGNNQLTITHLASGAVNTFSNVEFIRFDDKVVTYDPTYENFLSGGAENDLLEGTSLNDAINGGDGDDTIYGFDGDDFLSGDAGDDQLFGGAGSDWIFGVLGNDLIYGGEGDDNSFGGQDGDYIWGEGGDDQIRGEGGDDVLNGGDGDDEIEGNVGDDLLEGGDGRDTLYGDDGDDDIFGGDLGDSLFGGIGDDHIDAGSGWNYVEAGQGDDLIISGNGRDTIFGNQGDDTVYAGGGNDVIFAKRYENPFARHEDHLKLPANDSGADLVYAGSGNDSIYSIGDGDVVFAESGDDFIVYDGYVGGAISGGTGSDTLVVGHIYVDIYWYQSSNGEVGAILDHSNQVSHHSYPDHEYVRVKGIESFYFQRHAGAVTPGWTPISGYTDYGFQQTTITQLNESEWNALFSDEAFESFKSGGYHPESLNAADTVNNELKKDAGNDDIIDLSGDASFFGRFAKLPDGFQGEEYRVSDTSGIQRVNGNGGNDIIFAGSGADLIWGGNGNDTLDGESGADQIWGEGGDDLIYASSGDDYASGGGGNDRLQGGSGHDTLEGHSGDDSIFGESGRDSINGGWGNDFINGGDAPDTITGAGGDDTIRGGDGGDNIDGGADDDLLIGGLGIDSLHGGLGNDSLYGEGGLDQLNGGAGDDQLNGGSANDNLLGGTGNDRLLGGDGNDFLQGDEGNDILFGGSGSDQLDGGAGTDTADYSSSNAGVTVDLAAGTGAAGDAEGDILIGIENLIGSGNSDTLVGDNATNSILGGNGDDKLQGGGAADNLDGQVGNDYIEGNSGNDTLSGGSGEDILNGGSGSDVAFGGYEDDLLIGGAGNDTLDGGADNDLLFGDSGNDELVGGVGRDTLNGGLGNDVLTGGEGADLFGFEVSFGHDTISDFDITIDVLNFTGGVFEVAVSETLDGILLSSSLGDTVLLESVTATTDHVLNNLTISGYSVSLVDGQGTGDTTSGGTDTSGFNTITGTGRLIGTADADLFVMLADGQTHDIKKFSDGVDLIDLSAWGVTSLDQLTFREQGDQNGGQGRSFIEYVDGGQRVRLLGHDQAAVDALTIDDFVLF